MDELIPTAAQRDNVSNHAGEAVNASRIVGGVLAKVHGAWSWTGEIATTRLTLRAHQSSDLEHLVEFHGDAEVTRFIPWPVRDREHTAAALAVKRGQTVARDGQWIVLAVVHAADERVIGEVLLKRTSASEAEVGYAFSRRYQGVGYASEAVAALIAAVTRGLGLVRLTAEVDARNVASIRLLSALGFTPTDDSATHFERLP